MSGPPSSPRQPLAERTPGALLLVILCWPIVLGALATIAGYPVGLPHTVLRAIRFFLVDLLLWGVIFSIAFRLAGVTAAQLRLKTTRPLLALALGVAWFFVIRFLISFIFWETTRGLPSSTFWDMEEKIAILTDARNIAHHLPLSITVFAFAALSAGTMEELWRAGMLAGFKQLFPHWSAVTGILLSAILFSVAHLYQGPFGMINALIMGVFLGSIIVYRNSYWEAAVAHTLFDALAFGTVILLVMDGHLYNPRVVHSAETGDLPKIRHWVVMGGDVNATYDPEPDWKKITALEVASGRPHHEEVVRYLLENGADPNLADSRGITPLLAAAENDQLENVKLLVAHGAKINGQDAHGFTALRAAAEYNRLEVARFLIESGADLNIHDNDGLTPLAAATKWRYADLKNLLQQKGGK